MRKNLFNPIVLAAAVVLGATAYATAQTDFDWTGQLAPGQSIEIRGVNGTVRASAARDANIIVTAVKRSRRGNASDVRIETVSHAGGVTVCAVYPAPAGERANECTAGGRGNSNARDNDTVVDFTVQVPAGIGLIAATVNGSIDGTALQSDATGTTVNGSVNLSTTGAATATTVNGSIDATVGRVSANGGKFTTVNGDVTLHLPAAINADVRLATVSGRIRSDFPITIDDKRGPKSANGVLGSGGPRLDVNAVNGGINLLRR
jgi:DUF4097 and DUF4098 domain-containing protein YvlB